MSRKFTVVAAVLVFSLFVCLPGQVHADLVEGNFTYTVSDGKATVIGYDEVAGGTDVVIPGTLGGYPVTVIASNAFQSKGLTSVIIPNSVTTIGLFAFDSNPLTALTIGNGVTVIGGYAFRNNDLTSVEIPDSVEVIGNYAFAGSNDTIDLIAVTLGNSVRTIGWAAFAYNALESVVLPDSLEVIERNAFSQNSLESVQFGNRVTTIGIAAFNFNNLQSLDLPHSVTSLGEYAFQSNNLTVLNIGSGLTEIEMGTFMYNDLVSVTIPDTVESIGAQAFRYNDLEWAFIPGSVTSIGENAFANNQTLASNLTIVGRDGSEAHTYATANSFTFVNYYYATFKDYDGSVLEEQAVIHGEDASSPADPTRENYSFTGWDRDFTNVTEDLEVAALYQATEGDLPATGASWLYYLLVPLGLFLVLAGAYLQLRRVSSAA